MEECVEKIKKYQKLDTDTCIIFRYLVEDYGENKAKECFRRVFGNYASDIIRRCEQELEDEKLAQQLLSSLTPKH